MISEPSGATGGTAPTVGSSPNLSRPLRRSFGLVVLLFWVVLLARNSGELSSREWTWDPGGAALATLVFGLYFLGLGAGWTITLRATGSPLAMGTGVGVWLLSMPARYVPGSLWHILARIGMARAHRIAPEAVFASSTLEQVLTVLTAACLGVVWLPFWMGMGGIAGPLAFLLAAIACLQPPLLKMLVRGASRALGRPMPPFTLGYRDLAPLLVWYGLANAVNGMAFSLLAAATVEPSWTMWPAFASAYCLAYVVGYLSFLTPSGIGVREAALASMMALYMPVPAAVTLSLLARLLSTVGEAIAVLLVGVPLSRRPPSVFARLHPAAAPHEIER